MKAVSRPISAPGYLPLGVAPRASHLRRASLVLLALAFGAVTAQGGLAPRGALAQSAAPAPRPVATAADETPLTQPQLEQLLAPIALHPDDLLMQMLMAATYPLEVVQAQRWLGQGQNAALKGDALVQALNAQSWDASVKSLIPFPDIVRMMSDQLEWTQQLGDAVLEQQEDVLNAVQVLRGRAQAAGMLQSGPQQTVTVVQNVSVAPAAGAPSPIVAPPAQVISIAPTQPDLVYVPVYSPSVVYGTWPHPTYPPTYFPPPPGWGVGNAILTGMAFAAGAAVIGSLWGWARPGWGRGSVDIDANRVNNINVNRAQISSNRWQHNSANRHGVAYRNRDVSNRYRGGGSAITGDRAQSRQALRGRIDQVERQGGLGTRDHPGLGARPDGGTRPTLGNQPGGGDRPNLGNRPGGGAGGNLADRVAAGGHRPQIQRPAVAPSGRPHVSTSRPAASRAPQAFQGMGQGQQVRAAQQRGQASRAAQPAARAQAQRGGGGGQGRAAARQGGGGGRGH